MTAAQGRGGASPSLRDYRKHCGEFTWESARGELDGLPAGGLNIAHEAVDRHALSGRAGTAALRWIDRAGRAGDMSYADLRALSNRFAAALRALGATGGDCVATLCPRIPALWVAAFGALKQRCVFCPLFTSFGPDPIRTRLTLAEASILVTTRTLYARKVAPLRPALPHLRHVIITDDDGDTPETRSLDRLLEQSGPDFRIGATDPETPALLHFTSGTTGRPKAAVHVHEAVVAHHVTGRSVLDLRPGDVYWCTADPAWVTGTTYGIIAPLTNAVTAVIDEDEFDAARWYGNLQEQAVNVWYTAPTALRMLRAAGTDLAAGFDFPALRHLASVGEPLDPGSVVWGERTFGRPFHDTWWQTETGSIMVANFAGVPIKPGSMGLPVPGIQAALVRRTDSGVDTIDGPDEIGELALRAGWPSMFRGYLGDPGRYDRCFSEGWYLSGDLARCDADGYYWFVGRADDVIKSAGHLIGPFEVEAALLSHPAIREAAVVGRPDPMLYQIVEAFVTLNPGYAPGEPLRREVLAHARQHLGPAAAPRRLSFQETLPKTTSGKIRRQVLVDRAR